MANLKTIAKKAGLAEITVSRILRGKDQCSQATRQRVIDIAKRLKYRPNLLVKGMRTGRTQNIGVVLVSANEPSSALFESIHDELTLHDNVPIVLFTGGKRNKTPEKHYMSELRQLRRLVDHRIDAVLIEPTAFAVYEESLREIWEREIPLVLMIGDMDLPQADFVGVDEFRGGQLMAEHLIAQGHKRITHIVPPLNIPGHIHRVAGFREVMERHSEVEFCELGIVLLDSVKERARGLLESSDRPSAIFGSTDLIANEVYELAIELGIRVPEELAIGGFGDFSFSRQAGREMTTLRLPYREIAHKAVQLAFKRFEEKGEERKPREKVRLAPRLIVRQSTDPTLKGSDSEKTIHEK